MPYESRTAADLVIEELASSEAALRDHVASLEADVGVYRELAVVAFDIVQDLTRKNRDLVRKCDRIRDDVLHELWAAQLADDQVSA